MKYRKAILSTLFVLIFSIQLFSIRVVSLSPSITEIIFKIGHGDSIVGNTKFCNYPIQACSIKKIGGYLDINMEMIIDLKPDLIFHYPEHLSRLNKLRKFIRLVQVSHKNISDLLESIRIISRELNDISSGKALIRHINEKFDEIKKKKKIPGRKTVMIVIGRDPGQLKNITIIGRGDFLNEIIHISGGKNAYEGSISYPSVSIESIIKMNPDLILEFSFLKNAPDEESIKKIWKKFPLIKAVRNANIRIIKDDYWVRPGPRIGNIAESLYEMLLSD